MSIKLKGVSVSKGVLDGIALVIEEHELNFPKYDITEKDIDNELKRLKKSVELSKTQINMIKKRAEKNMDSETIKVLDAHIMMLDDPLFFGEVKQKLNQKLKNIETIIYIVMKKFIEMFDNMDDKYLKERAVDIKEIGSRIINNLQEIVSVDELSLEHPVIIVSSELTASELLRYDPLSIIGIITEKGGKTSHAVIFAKTYQIPIVTGIENVSDMINDKDKLIIDADNGIVIVNPTDKTKLEYRKKISEYKESIKKKDFLKDIEPITKDGLKIRIGANLAVVSELQLMEKYGIDEIGLYRTEYLFLNRKTLPTEDEQYYVYREIAEKSCGRVVIRTLDVGGDKYLKSLNWPDEENPFMGWRAIRFCFDNIDIFKAQLKALLRAADHGNIDILIPMVTNMEEIARVKCFIENAKKELKEENKKFSDNVKIGVLIETPSAAMIVDKIVKKIDFISIGTNDLVQFTLAVDRMNEKIDFMFDPFHPAIVEMIDRIIKVAHKNGKKVGMCGEMAGNPMATELLLGMGLDMFSMNFSSIPYVKSIIRRIDINEAKKTLRKVKKFLYGREIREFLQKRSDEIIKKADIST